jgi:hypothetical protein
MDQALTSGPDMPLLASSEAERFVIGSLRRALHGSSPCTLRAPDSDRDMAATEAIIRAAFRPRQPSRMRAIQLNPHGSLDLTKDERRLLRATAAAQAGNLAILDNYLFKLALDRTLRCQLAEAITRLGAILAVRGHWLTSPGSWAIPAGALMVARARGRNLAEIRVTWS